jgi:sugar lactone lactonase YvrE
MVLNQMGYLWVNSAGNIVRNCANDWGKEPDWQRAVVEHPAPSGLSFDADGNLYLGCWSGGLFYDPAKE